MDEIDLRQWQHRCGGGHRGTEEIVAIIQVGYNQSVDQDGGTVVGEEPMEVLDLI